MATPKLYKVVYGLHCPASYIMLVPDESGSITWGDAVKVDAERLADELGEEGPPSSRTPWQATSIERFMNSLAGALHIDGKTIFWKDPDGTRRVMVVERHPLSESPVVAA